MDDTLHILAQSEPRRRLSYVRVAGVALVSAGIVWGAVLSFSQWQDKASASVGHDPWFAGYVDVTSTPSYAFEKRADKNGSDAVLAFVVSSEAEPCTPAWGGHYTLDQAAVYLDLDRRIARLQQQGGKIAVSFGGALHSELALQCANQDALLGAYDGVISRYNINTIDLDLENQSLSDAGASKRRADVIARLQKQYRQHDKTLAVWLTLPVSPQGLTEDGTNAVAQMLASGVDLAGVNLMTMDYGESRDSHETMAEASEHALTEAHRQLGVLYMRAGVMLDSDALWKKIGATPMLGQNDIADEIFTLDDAVALNRFARDQGIGRMSMWSANRDIPCGENYVDVKVVSDLCSGVTSPVHAFTQALSDGFDGDLMQNATMVTISNPASNVHIVDDPKTSPYQIWQESGVYLKGTKVVWHGNVYEAKWWTKNDLPDNPVLQAYETPWQLVGPVLPGDKPVKLLTLPAGTYPEWYGQVPYNEGDRVLFQGVPYEAKWWTEGDSPAAAASSPDNSPWLPLTQEQIVAILKARGGI